MNKELENNNLQRMEFVERWANFVINNDNKTWSKLQADFIDSQIDNALQIKLTKEQVEYIKGK